MSRKKFKTYRKVYRKSKAFARREYVEPYEFDSLDKGYYHGYVDGVTEAKRAIKKHLLTKDIKKYVGEIIDEVLGEPTILII